MTLSTETGFLDILNIKLDPYLIRQLLTKPGYLPAYHMNREKWLSVRLDGSVPLEEILPLLDMSFELTCAGNGRGRGKSGFYGGSGQKEMQVAGQSWVIPANPKNYDVAAGFKREGTLIWHIRPYVCEGDTIFIYETLPIGAILFKCEVVEADIPYSNPMFPGATRAMRIKLLRQYPEGLIDREFMRRHGVANVRSARVATYELVRAIAALEKEGKAGPPDPFRTDLRI